MQSHTDSKRYFWDSTQGDRFQTPQYPRASGARWYGIFSREAGSWGPQGDPERVRDNHDVIEGLKKRVLAVRDQFYRSAPVICRLCLLWGPPIYPTQILVPEQGTYALWDLVVGGGQCLLLGGGRSAWCVTPPCPSPTWQVASGVSGKATAEGQSARVSWAVHRLGIAQDCTCNQGKLWSFRLLYSELNFGSKHGGYSETQ